MRPSWCSVQTARTTITQRVSPHNQRNRSRPLGSPATHEGCPLLGGDACLLRTRLQARYGRKAHLLMPAAPPARAPANLACRRSACRKIPTPSRAPAAVAVICGTLSILILIAFMTVIWILWTKQRTGHLPWQVPALGGAAAEGGAPPEKAAAAGSQKAGTDHMVSVIVVHPGDQLDLGTTQGKHAGRPGASGLCGRLHLGRDQST